MNNLNGYDDNVPPVCVDNSGILVALKEMMNFTLLKNPMFALIGISNFFGMMGFYTPFVYLPNMAVEKVRCNHDTSGPLRNYWVYLRDSKRGKYYFNKVKDDQKIALK